MARRAHHIDDACRKSKKEENDQTEWRCAKPVVCDPTEPPTNKHGGYEFRSNFKPVSHSRSIIEPALCFFLRVTRPLIKLVTQCIEAVIKALFLIQRFVLSVLSGQSCRPS